MARRLGWSEQQLASLHQPEKCFSPAEQAALHFAEVMTLDAHGVTDEMFAQLRKHFIEGEIVELAAIVGLYNYFNRFNEALDMESD